MPGINIILNGDGAFAELADRKEDIIVDAGQMWDLAALPGGMSSGKTSVALRFVLPDGKIFITQTSLAAFMTAANALRAAYGHELEGM